MGQIVDIGRRIELVPMDTHFHDITIALYHQEGEGSAEFLAQTYSRLEGAGERVVSAVGAMEVLGEMNVTPEGLLRFPCGGEHEVACRRLFLEACKLDPKGEIEPRPLTILDKKSGRNITVISLGEGVYQVAADGEEEGKERRIAVVVNGLMKLGEMLGVEGCPDRVAFGCGHAHDALVGLLLVRAPNVRALVREQQMIAARGILSSPSQQ